MSDLETLRTSSKAPKAPDSVHSSSITSSSRQEDPEERLRAKVYTWTCLFIAATGFFFMILSLFTGELPAALGNAPIPILGLAAFFSRHHRYREWFKILFLASTLLAMVAISVTLGGVASPVWHWTGLLPLLFAATFGWKRAIPWIIATGISFIVVFSLPHLTSLPVPPLEIHHLAGMLGCLAVTFAIISRYQKVTEAYRKQINQQAKKNDLLLRVLCHDLSTPLQMINFATAELDDKDPQIRKSKLRIQRGADSMTTMISQTREFIRARSQQKGREHNIISLDSCVSTALRLVESQAQKKGIQFRFRHSGHGSRSTIGNKTILSHQVIGNLLKNAIKFSHPQSEVLVSTAHRRPGFVTLTIADRGVGIPHHLFAEIFDVKTSRSLPGTKGEKGSGFGLPIAASYVHSLGGKIKIRSRTESPHGGLHGTVIQVWLPAASR